MSERSYVTLDVFTNRRFGGNQLAVFPNAEGLPTETMQAIARELSLSETVFLASTPDPQTWDARIFTPAMELPFAGHPTIGSAIALALLGRLSEPRIILNEGVGPVPVQVSAESASMGSAVLTAPKLSQRLEVEYPPPAALAEMIGLKEADLGPIDPVAYSAGVPFTFLSVRSCDELDAASLDGQRWEANLQASAAPHLVVLTLGSWRDGNEISLRMFAPAMGIAEDPATGAAAAALAGLLIDLQQPGDGTSRWTISQGVKMGRPSEINLEADIASGRPAAVRIGGSAVLMSRGSMEIGEL